MKSLHTIQKLSGIGKVLSKIAYIFAVIGFAGCTIMVRGRKDVSLIYNREV
mgnify:CR=1 FL=1